MNATVLRQNINRYPTMAAMTEATGIITSGPRYITSGSIGICSTVMYVVSVAVGTVVTADNTASFVPT